MPSHRGTKTAAAGAAATASFGAMWFDPTGATALTFCATSIATAFGASYHLVKGTTKHVSKAMDENRQRKAEDQARTLKMTIAQHIQFQYEVENTIRKLTSALEGASVTSILLLGLPYMGIIWAINSVESGFQIRRLKMLANRAGGRRALVRTISKRNAVAQAAIGATIKTATISITLGHDFDAAINSVAGHVSDFDYNALLKEAGDEHEQWLEHSVISRTTDAIDQPQDAVKKFFESLEGDFDNKAQPWTWEEGHSAEGVVALGATVAVVNKTIDYTVDDNLHNAAETVTGTDRKG